MKAPDNWENWEVTENLILAEYGESVKGATFTQSGRDVVAKCASPEMAKFIMEAIRLSAQREDQ